MRPLQNCFFVIAERPLACKRKVLKILVGAGFSLRKSVKQKNQRISRNLKLAATKDK